jgi:hypothetical protein
MIKPLLTILILAATTAQAQTPYVDRNTGVIVIPQQYTPPQSNQAWVPSGTGQIITPPPPVAPIYNTQFIRQNGKTTTVNQLGSTTFVNTPGEKTVTCTTVANYTWCN